MYDTCICNDVGQFCLIEKFTKSVIVAATKYNQLPSEILVISEERYATKNKARNGAFKCFHIVSA
jgi:hypothetical protein